MEAATSPHLTKECASSVLGCFHQWTPECDQVDAETSSFRLYWTARKRARHLSFHAAKNPNLKPRHRRRIIDAIHDKYRPDNYFPGGVGVILNPGVTDEELRLLSKSYSDKVLEMLASHMLSRLDLDGLMNLASGSQSYVHDCLVAQEGLPSEVYKQSFYVAQYDKHLMGRLAENPSVGADVLYYIIRLDNWDDATFAALTNKNTPIGHLFKREAWARNPKTYDRAVYARRAESEAWLAERGFELNVPVEWLRELI